jgi:hypothetical protein
MFRQTFLCLTDVVFTASRFAVNQSNQRTRIKNIIHCFIAFFYYLCHIFLMTTLQQTVEIPTDRRLFIDVPEEIPVGATGSLIFDGFGDDEIKRLKNLDTPLRRKYPTLISLVGSCKGDDTMEEYFARKRAEKEFEDRQYVRRHREANS